MHEKLTKFPNFTSHMPENINKMHEFYMIFARKNIFPNLGRGQVTPCGATWQVPPPPSPTPRAYGITQLVTLTMCDVFVSMLRTDTR